MSSKSGINNLMWKLLERFGTQGVTFIVSIILARLLDPSVYGVIAIVTVFLSILQVFVDSGLGNALIQKKDADDLDFCTTFYFNLVLSVFLYLCIFFMAPLIADFYNEKSLCAIIRVLCISLIISGVKNIQYAYVAREMIFKSFFFSTLFGTISSAAVGIVLAILDFGVWALVAQHLVSTFVNSLTLIVFVKWRPELKFSFNRLKKLYSFGWKLLVASLIEAVYTDASQLIIGKKYSTADLAYFNKGKHFPSFFVSNINSSIKSVTFPMLSKVQDNIGDLKNMTKKAITTSIYVMAPLLLGLFAIADNFIVVFLTEKWISCAIYVRLFCISYLFQPLQTANKNAFKARGKSGLFMKIELISKAVGFCLLLAAFHFGVIAIALSMVVSSILEQFLLAFLNRKQLNYGFFEQLKDVSVPIILSTIMAVIVYSLSFLPIPIILTLIIQVLSGIIIYISLSVIFREKNFIYLSQLVLNTIKRNKPKTK